MTLACQLTEIPQQEFPELIQFYRHFPQKYPFLLSTSSKKFNHQQAADFDILFIEPEQWLNLDHDLKLTSSSQLDIKSDELFLDAFDRIFDHEKSSEKKSVENNTGQQINKASQLPFMGGWFIFLAYELAQQVEPHLKQELKPDKQLLPVAYAARVKKALIYDHQNDTIFFLSEPGIDHETCFQALLKDSKTIEQAKQTQLSLKPVTKSLLEEDDQEFLKSVTRVKKYIKEGDVFQVNLSRLWQSSFQCEDPSEMSYALSAALSKKNPAPFSGLANFTSEQGIASIISSSPERLLKVEDNWLESRPIAGTHPRSRSPAEDSRLLNELHAHPKEQAEHIMLIDLIRNDLGRVCVPGTVTVDELMVSESYAHVHHIVSNVSGQLQPGKTPGEVIKAMFPGGTITGCPKVRCMEIIAELEQHSRGAYTGSMGYINLDGSMDLNILIRTMVLETVLERVLETVSETASETASEMFSKTVAKHNSTLRFRAGAGLVFDSIAEKELQETRAKAKGLLRALQVEL